MGSDRAGTQRLLPDGTRIGRVLLRVRSFAQAVPFYRDVIGLKAIRTGDRVVLGTADQSLVLLEEAPSLPARSPAEAGLFHVAFRVPSRGALGEVLARIREEGWALGGASDHLVSEALYLSDPDGNGVEVYRDRPHSQWPIGPNNRIEMDTRPLDVSSLEREAVTGTRRVPSGTDIGHIHLEVIDLSDSEDWYGDRLGFSVMTRYGNDAVFLAAGGYHHHVGLNTWTHRSVRARGNRGLGWFEIGVPTTDAQQEILTRVRPAGSPDTVEVTDPNGILVRITADQD